MKQQLVQQQLVRQQIVEHWTSSTLNSGTSSCTKSNNPTLNKVTWK